MFRCSIYLHWFGFRFAIQPVERCEPDFSGSLDFSYFLRRFLLFHKRFCPQRKGKAEGTGEAESKERFLFMRLVYILFPPLCLFFLLNIWDFTAQVFFFFFISHAYLANKKNGKMKTMRDGLVFSLAFVSAVWFLFHYVLLVPTPAGLLI